ncbi:MAG: NAD(P)H-hydrate epimerase [Sedimentisphaerales bacterium]|nr:NAD(P)H-hydrate epimerase [Sedimentisphaerales bacterium]
MTNLSPLIKITVMKETSSHNNSSGNHKRNDQAGLVLSREQARRCDRIAIERFEINGLVLMENAGAAAARLILSLPDDIASCRVCVVAGVGNNAGDGFVVARHLSNANVPVDVILCGDRERYKGDAGANLRIIERMALPIICLEPGPPDAAAVVQSHAASADIIVDAMLGTGAVGAPREPIRSAIEVINDLQKTVVALDIPSGLDCDTGQPLEAAVCADHTVTFAAMKKGFQSPEAGKYTGTVTVASIGINTLLLQ